MSTFAEIPQKIPVTPSNKNHEDVTSDWFCFDKKSFSPVGFVPSYKNAPSTGYHDKTEIREISKLEDLLLPDDWKSSGGTRETPKLIYSETRGKISKQKAKAELTYDDIEVNFDNELFTLPKELRKIAEEIEHSKSILELTDNWNDEGAIAIPKEILLRSVKLLISYSEWIFLNLAIVIEAPIISPLPNGSIDMKWLTKRMRLLLNVKNSIKPEAHYYGDYFNGESSFKGKISTNEVQEFFALSLFSLRN